MKLTNKQLDIVVDEIYNQVSKPIMEANNKAFDAVKIDETKDQYLTDKIEYAALSDSIQKLEDQRDFLEKKYYKKEFNGYNFKWYPFNDVDDYIKYQKSKLVKTKEYPSKNDIEKQVILAGNKEIPELIELLVKKLQ